MAKLKIKKDDLVEIISGASKGERGKIVSVDTKNNRAVVEGVNKVKRHTKPTAKYPNGGIVEKEASIHISNLKQLDSDLKELHRHEHQLQQHASRFLLQ